MKFLLLHIIPLLIACLFFFYSKDKIDNYYQEKYKSDFGFITENYIPTFNQNRLSENITLSNALDKSIPVVFGSSELTSHHLNALCYNFFKEHQLSIQAFGHAGFQCFAISNVIAANRPVLKNSKIAIILSPGWFEGSDSKGTDLQCFFEYNNDVVMNQIYCDNQLSNSYKTYYANYIKRKYGQINSPSNMINQFYTYNDKLYAPFNFMYEKVSHSSYDSDVYNKLLLNLSQDTIQYRFQNFKPNWDSLYQSAIEEFKKTSTNNDLGVENEYYANRLKGKSEKKFKITENSQEYQDFKMLLSLCKELNCKPVFIIMPLNTLAYKNAKELEPTIKNIESELKQNDFKYLDMFTPALSNYQIGTTEDVMHPGNYGWYQMDKFIIEEFSSK